MHAERDGPRRFAEDGHLGRVTPKGTYLALHPQKRKALVLQAEVALDAGGRVVEPAQGAHAVLHHHEHHVARQRQPAAVVPASAAGLGRAVRKGRQGEWGALTRRRRPQ